MRKPFLTTAEAAERLGLSVSQLNRLAASGHIPVAQQLPGPRGTRLYRPRDIDRAIERRVEALRAQLAELGAEA